MERGRIQPITHTRNRQIGFIGFIGSDPRSADKVIDETSTECGRLDAFGQDFKHLVRLCDPREYPRSVTKADRWSA
jgi:hypothetical protein